MNEEAEKNPQTKVLGGILFLVIYMAIIILIAKQFESGDGSLQKGIGITAIASMIVYVIIVKRFHFDLKKKLYLIVILLVVLDVGGIYLGRYFYWNSPSMPEVKRVIDGIAQIKLNAKLQELTPLRRTILAHTETIKIKPQSIEQGKKYLDIIDQLYSLHKKSYDLTRHFHEQILELIASVRNVQDREKVEAVLRDKGRLSIGAISVFRKQHDIWYKALTDSLSARKVYYESFIKHESQQHQDYLWRKWSTLEDFYLQEESKLYQIRIWYGSREKLKEDLW